MPYRLDSLDATLLNALLNNGRLSYRQLAKQAHVSAPTVESRVRRLVNLGVIRKVVPIIDLGKISEGVGALVSLRVESRYLNEVSKAFSEIDQVRGIFFTIGESNVILRLAVKDVSDLQDLLDTRLSREGVTINSSQIITKSVKDEQGIVIRPELLVTMNCDYCGSSVSGRPYKISVGDGERFFCCRTCQSSYKEKYSSRIAGLVGEAR